MEDKKEEKEQLRQALIKVLIVSCLQQQQILHIMLLHLMDLGRFIYIQCLFQYQVVDL